jgi:hypothetical protein
MSQDNLLASTDREEALSRAYLQAVAAGAGYAVASLDFDRDGIDCEIKAGGRMRPALGVQLKATVNLGEAVDGCYRYPLKRRNYDLLRAPTQTPRLLVVLALPTDEAEWLTVSDAELVMRRCAYWASLADAPDSDNRASVTVALPERNRFDVDALRALMDRSRTGVIR